MFLFSYLHITGVGDNVSLSGGVEFAATSRGKEGGNLIFEGDWNSCVPTAEL
jgi:hypothetical protein